MRKAAVLSGVRGAECMRCRHEVPNLISLKPRWRFAYFADTGKVGRPAGRNIPETRRRGGGTILPRPQAEYPIPVPRGVEGAAPYANAAICHGGGKPPPYRNFAVEVTRPWAEYPFNKFLFIVFFRLSG